MRGRHFLFKRNPSFKVNNTGEAAVIEMQTALAASLAVANVKVAGDQTVDGVKTFVKGPIFQLAPVIQAALADNTTATKALVIGADGVLELREFPAGGGGGTTPDASVTVAGKVNLTDGQVLGVGRKVIGGVAVGQGNPLNALSSSCVAIGTNAYNLGTSASVTALGHLAGANTANTVTGSVFIGRQSGENAAVGSTQVTAVGTLSGQNASAANAVHIGYNAGVNNSGVNSINIGLTAGGNSSSSNAIHIGSSAGQFSTTTTGLFMGPGSGQYFSGGSNNIGIGGSALRNGSGATNAVAIGASAGIHATGSRSTAIGGSAGQSNGVDTTAVGANALIGRAATPFVASAVLTQTAAGVFSTSVAIDAQYVGKSILIVPLTNAATNAHPGIVAGNHLRFLVDNVNQLSADPVRYPASENTKISGNVEFYQEFVTARVSAYGVSAGQHASVDDAVYIGCTSGSYNTALYPTFVGYGSGHRNSGTSLVAIGRHAAYNNNAANVNAVGHNAVRLAVDSNNTVAVGHESAEETSESPSSVFIGSGAGRRGYIAPFSTFVGAGSGFYVTNQNNSGLGINSGSAALGAMIGAAGAYTATQVDILGNWTISPALDAGLINQVIAVRVSAVLDHPEFNAIGSVMIAKVLTTTTVKIAAPARFTAAGNTKRATCTLLNVNNFANTTSLGANSFPTASNQVVLGDTNVVELRMGNSQHLDLAQVRAATEGQVLVKTLVSGKHTVQAKDYTSILSDIVQVSASRNLTLADDDKILLCTAEVTLTIPDGLVFKRGVVAIPPETGNLTVASVATVSINGTLGESMILNRANNAAGVGILYLGAANKWGVSGDEGGALILPDASSTVKGAVRLAADLGGSATNPSVTAIKGIGTPDNAPSIGMFYIAESATKATWSNAYASLTTTGVVNLEDAQVLGANRKTIDNIQIGQGHRGIASRSGNTLIGMQVAPSVNIGDNVTAIGRQACNASTVDISGTTAVGNAAGRAHNKVNGALFGAWAGENNTGANATLLGQAAGQNNTAPNSVLVGTSAGNGNTGASVVGVGVSALQANTGVNATAMGEGAGYWNSGTNCTFIGFQTKRFATTGNNQTFIGSSAGYSNFADGNVAIGNFAARWQTAASTRLTALGVSSGNLVEGANNTMLGSNAGAVRPTALATNVTITQVSPGNFTISPALAAVPTSALALMVTAATATPISTLGVGGEAFLTFTSTSACTAPSWRYNAIDNGKTATIDLYQTYNVTNSTCVGADTAPDLSNQVVLGNSAVTSIRMGNGLILDITGLLAAADGSRATIRTVNGRKTIVADSNTYQNVGADYTVLATDAEKQFACTAPVVVTLNTTSKDTIWFPPLTGAMTIRAGVGVTLNGASADITRTFLLNRAGISIIANPLVANDFSVTGF